MFRGVGYLSGKSKSAPSLNLDFLLGGLDSRITFTRASNAWYFNGAGNLVQASTNEPRFDYNPSTLQARGLLVETSRTNGIRNPRLEGAAAGTPGTDPTYMFFGASATGLTKQIVAVGSENGFSTIDVRWFGTTTSSGRLQFFLEGGDAIVASVGQFYAVSHFSKVVAGTYPVSSSIFAFAELDSGFNILAQTLVDCGAPYSSGTRISAARRFSVSTITNAATAWLRPVWFSDLINSGIAIDVTIRFAAPQTELGAFPTSPIFPAVGSPAASTRAADLGLTTPVTPWFNSAEGTMLAEFEFPYFPTYAGTVGNQELFRIDNTSATNALALRMTQAGAGSVYCETQVFAGGSTVFDGPNNSFLAAQVCKMTLAYGSSGYATAFNGGAVTSAAGALPTGINRMFFGGNNNAGAGYIRRLAYYPTRLSNTTLQGLTA